MAFGSKKNLVGLDLGTHSVKEVELKDLGRGKGYRLVSFGQEVLPAEAVVGGTIMDSGAVIDAIRDLVSKENVRGASVASSIDGAMVVVKRIQMSAMSEAEVAEAIRWEAEQYIPFDIDEVKIDYHVLDSLDGGEQLSVILVAAKQEPISQITSIIGQSGLQLSTLDVDAFAIQNAFEINYPIQGEEVTALVNIGAGTTNITVLKGDDPLFWRDIQFGGQNYTDALVRDLNLTRDQAEVLKRGQDVGGTRYEQAVPILNSVTDEFGSELKKTLDFFTVTVGEKDIHRIYLSGGASRVANLDRYLSQSHDIPVEIFNPFRNIQVDSKQFDMDVLNSLAPGFVVAVGLALRKMGE